MINYIKLGLMLTCIALILNSCKKELHTSFASISHKSSALHSEKEEYILGIHKVSGTVGLFKTFNENPELLVFGGDMLIYRKEIEPIKIYKHIGDIKRSEIDSLKAKYAINKFIDKAPKDTDSLYCISKYASIWPNNEIVFAIDPKLDDTLKNIVSKAIYEWSKNTNLYFTQLGWSGNKNDQIKNRPVLYIKKSKNGYDGATTGIPIHYNDPIEMYITTKSVNKALKLFGHVLGYVHEHQRPSRNEYLTMDSDAEKLVIEHFGDNWSLTLWEEMFDTYPVHNDKIDFDFNSIMLLNSYYNDALKPFLKEKNMALYKTKDGKIIEDAEISSLTKKIIDRTNLVYPEKPRRCPGL